MVNCSRPECQTTAGCTCANRLYEFDRQRAEIASLQERIRELEGALEPFAIYVEAADACYDTPYGYGYEIAMPVTSPFDLNNPKTITLGDLRTARAALKGTKP